MIVGKPLFLITAEVACWKCSSTMVVCALIAPTNDEAELDGEVPILMHTTALPEGVEKLIQSKVPTFVLAYSHTVGEKYYANTCKFCGAISGDFHLHSKPGSAFHPIDETQASNIVYSELEIDSPVETEASYRIGSAEFILENASHHSC